MAKVFGVHYISLQPGLKPAEFEAFIAQRWSQRSAWPGVTIHVLKGERGDRVDRYLLLMEFESQATRDRYFPDNDVVSEEAQQQMAAMAPLVAEWTKYASFGGSPTLWTDYIALASG